MLTKSGAEEAGFCCPQIEHEECFATRLCKLDTIMNVLDTLVDGLPLASFRVSLALDLSDF